MAPNEIPRIAVTPAAVTKPTVSTTYHSGNFTGIRDRLVAAPLEQRGERDRHRLAADKERRHRRNRRVLAAHRCLLPGHASEGHRAGDFLDMHLDDCALRGPGYIDDVLVELCDSVAFLANVLNHELVDFPLDEGRLLDLRGLLDGLHGPSRAAGIALEHRDPALLDEPRVGPAAFLTEHVRVDVGLDPLFDLLRGDLALEHDPAAFHRARGPELPQEIGQDHVWIPTDCADDVLEVPEDRRLALNDDVRCGDLKTLPAAQGRRQRLLGAREELFITEGGHEGRPKPASV